MEGMDMHQPLMGSLLEWPCWGWKNLMLWPSPGLRYRAHTGNGQSEG